MKQVCQKSITYSLLIIISSLLLASCGNSSSKQQESTNQDSVILVKAPIFNSDSAYSFIEKQVDFGPRVPNTKAHKACSKFLVKELTRFGAEVIEQNALLVAYNNTLLESVNIIGSFRPEATTRIALFAHWDCRPYSDNDADPKNYYKPLMGADDGASGVGVLLEIARLMGQELPTVGIDIILFDAEDYGQPSFLVKEPQYQDSWCLGSQHWAKNPHKTNYRARYGVLVDMVGSSGAAFHKEKISMTYAPHVVEKYWSKARELGYGNYFVNKEVGSIVDDHLYINEIIGIPCIDIINFSDQGFGSHWHTINDTMDNIDKNTLKSVGQTLLEVIYAER